MLVLNADIISDVDMQALVDLFRRRGGEGAISLKEVAPEDVVHYGVAAMDPQDRERILGFVEKPRRKEDAPSRLINAGAYVLPRSVLDRIRPGRMVSMEKEIFPVLIEPGFFGLPFDGHWIDVGDPARLRAASHHLDPDTWHGPDADIAGDAKVLATLAGADLRIGAGAVVEGCVLGDGVTVAPGIRLVDCVVGDGETVESSTDAARIWSRPVPDGYPSKQVGNAITT